MITNDCNRTEVILHPFGQGPFGQGEDPFVEGIFQAEFAGEVVRPVLLPATVVALCPRSGG